MNRSRFLKLGAISLVLGSVASFYFYRYLQLKSGKPPEPMIGAIVSAKDLQVGARLEEADIRIVRIPVSSLPPDSPRRPADLIGRGVILPISKGQFILSSQLAGENISGLPSLIPPGMRAVGVRVNEVSSMAGFVAPGTRVDVLMTGTVNREQRTITVMQNASVLAMGHTLERNSGGEPQNVNVATLLVNLDDAERLILASNEGRVQLVLRNPLDTRAEQVKGASIQQLYPPGVEPKAARHPRLQPILIPVSAPTSHEIQIFQGSDPPHVTKCKDGGDCAQEK